LPRRPNGLQRLPKQCRLLKSNSLLNTDWPRVWTMLLWLPDVFIVICWTLRGVRTPSKACVGWLQELAVLTWKLHGIFMDIFLETCDHIQGMKWDTVHITWRLWIEPTILLKSNRYIKCFCQPKCCQYKIQTGVDTESNFPKVQDICPPTIRIVFFDWSLVYGWKSVSNFNCVQPATTNFAKILIVNL